MASLRVLCLKENFTGSHRSFDVFYETLIEALHCCGCEVYYADQVAAAIAILDRFPIDFSICIGRYSYVFNGVPLYELYKTVNYQWIIDNPYKYDLNKSRYNRFIFIDEEFQAMGDFAQDSFLSLSLGGPRFRDTTYDREDAILVPWNIRDPDEINLQIEKSPIKNEIFSFLREYDYDSSFIMSLEHFYTEHGWCEETLKRELFRHTNSYLRVAKRIRMLNAIKKHQLIILSDQPVRALRGDHIRYLPAQDFRTVCQLQRKFRYVLNCNPNYDRCVHERISYAVANGAIVISDANSLLRELNFPLLSGSGEFHRIDAMIDSITDLQAVAARQRNIIGEFSMENRVKKICADFLRICGG